MTQIVQATYSNGNLVLDKKLSAELEGKKVQIMILDAVNDYENEDEATRQKRIQRFLEKVDKHRINLPPDYKFNRDELYDR